MYISIVIPTHNRKELLHRCLEAATQQDYPDYEVIVVDDGSTDGTGEMVRREFPQVRYIRQEPNRGPAAARNQGIEVATGEIIAFTDDDCLIPVDFLSRLADGYRRYPKVAGVGGYQEAPDEVLHHNPFARYEAYMTRQFYKAAPQEYLGGFECPAGGTNSMSYLKNVLLEVGGFDESFPCAAGEDADLKWRIVEKGYQLLYIPVKVIHLHPYSLRSFWSQQVRRGVGAAYFERKYSGRYPSRIRVGLRWLKRSLAFWPDLVTLGPTLAVVRLLANWAEVYGQWLTLRHNR